MVTKDKTGQLTTHRARLIYKSDRNEASFKQRLDDVLESILVRTPRWIKRTASIAFHPRALLIFGAINIVLTVFTVYYYNELAREIDARLERSTLDNSVQIVSSPLKISVGDRIPVKELTSYLRAAGYSQSASAGEAASTGYFSNDASSLFVMPGLDSASQQRLSPLRISFNKEEKVTAITNAKTGEQLKSALVEGELLASLRDGDRRKNIAVSFSEIPSTLRDAILAVEDRRFFSHSGVDYRGIIRALKADLDQGEVSQGGSTITQQLVKNSFLTTERTFSRKVKEAAMALILESRLSKEQIFEHYFNSVYLGQSGTFAVHGFAQAAQVYFDKDPKDLSVSESAFLAGLIHAPNRYAAHRDTAKAIERRNHVIDAMVETGAITESQAQAAQGDQLRIKRHEVQDDFGTTYFVDYVQRFIEERFGDRGLATRQEIATTLDPLLQRAAYESVKANTARLDKVFARAKKKDGEAEKVQATLVAIDAHTGEVLAMVGGRSYDESQLNRATDAMRQPGSTFKPFVYAAALGSRSYTAASLLSDRPQSFSYDGGRRSYKPTNYHGGFTNRDVGLREALARSLNVPTVELAMSVGLGNISQLGEECGLGTLRPYPSIALGASEVTPLALAGAYTAFANDGMALRPIPIRSATSINQGGAGEKITATGVRVFSPHVAYLMTNLMESVVDAGTASKLRGMGIKGAIAGKTGTSNDGWFVGYTPNLICVAWVGFDDNRDLHMKASDAALPMWADFMKQALALRPSLGGDSFARPGGIVTVEIDPTTGYLAGPECEQHRPEIFIAGTEPAAACNHQTMAESSELYPVELESTDTLEPDPYGTITLDICAQTGLIASSECSRVVRRSFNSGTEPRELCSGERQQNRYPSQPPTLEPVTRSESDAPVNGEENPKPRASAKKAAARQPLIDRDN